MTTTQFCQKIDQYYLELYNCTNPFSIFRVITISEGTLDKQREMALRSPMFCKDQIQVKSSPGNETLLEALLKEVKRFIDTVIETDLKSNFVRSNQELVWAVPGKSEYTYFYGSREASEYFEVDSQDWIPDNLPIRSKKAKAGQHVTILNAWEAVKTKDGIKTSIRNRWKSGEYEYGIFLPETAANVGLLKQPFQCHYVEDREQPNLAHFWISLRQEWQNIGCDVVCFKRPLSWRDKLWNLWYDLLEWVKGLLK